MWDGSLVPPATVDVAARRWDDRAAVFPELQEELYK